MSGVIRLCGGGEVFGLVRGGEFSERYVRFLGGFIFGIHGAKSSSFDEKLSPKFRDGGFVNVPDDVISAAVVGAEWYGAVGEDEHFGSISLLLCGRRNG